MRGKLLGLMCVLAGALIATSLAVGAILDEGAEEPAALEDDEQAAHTGGDHQHSDESPSAGEDRLSAHQPRHDHALAGGEGHVPSRAEASEFEHRFERFVVRGDEGLEQMVERGYVDGEGTLEDPYRITRFRVEDTLSIEDTSRPIVIEGSYIEGQLKLNYVGEDVHVHHNYVHDLRVNENVEREGPTTAGLFERNEIAFIGQLRHFSGTFAHNEIGPRPDGVAETYLSDSGPAQLGDDLVWNFDGYHGAHVHNNTVQGGRVDVKLHGHFHGSCLACTPHEHHREESFPTEEERANRSSLSPHSYRHHVLDLENNTIDAGPASTALRIFDRAHAADDRTANSEPHPDLEHAHEHHAYLRAHGNDLQGGALVFDVVNAEDERHEGLIQRAMVDLTGNLVEQERPRGSSAHVSAYVVHDADALELHAEGNRFAFEVTESSAPEGYAWAVDGEPAEASGFLLHDVDASELAIQATRGQQATYGVTLDGLGDADVLLRDNSFDASREDRHER